MLVRASSAEVEWSAKDKLWHVHIQVGAEVIKRPLKDMNESASVDVLRAAAVDTSKNEGYEVAPEQVVVKR